MLWSIFKNKPNSKHSHNNIAFSIATDPGCLREANEDNFYAVGIGCKPQGKYSFNGKFNCDKISFFAVFDGMGGESYGEDASRISAETLGEFYNAIVRRRVKETDIEAIIVRFIAAANGRICEMISQRRCKRSGCTMAMVVLYEDNVYAFSVGDSRIYCKTANALKQISEDQTLAVKKLKANIYTEDEARTSSDAHKLTSYIGVDDRGIGVSYRSYKPFRLSDSTLLLCSDGLTDMCSDEEILAVLSGKIGSPAEKLVRAAKENGGEDNITCIVINAE